MLINKRYKVISKIGQGAIAEVFKAVDTLTEKIVALKIAKPDPISEEKIMNEFKITSQFEHPNIILAYDFGTIRICDDSNFLSRKFITLEYCDIQDIVKFVSNKDFKDKLQAILQISHALHVIHKAGFIHRDLKPENILINSSTGIVKITDLGLAIGYEKTNPENLPVGTLYYIAPEILRGEKFDHRADIYSLGVLSVYILTEKLSFNADEPIEILKWHLSKKQLQFPNLPDEVQNLLNSMLAPNPEERPSDLREVINTLKKLTPDIKEPKSFKVRKPLGKDEALKKAIEILNSTIQSSGKITLIVGADGLGKTSLLRYINIEPKLLGFETLWIAETNIEKTLNSILKSPFTLNLSPELRLKLEKFKDEKNINSYIIIEFSQFLRTLLLEASSNFPIAVLIDNINPAEPFSEIFIKSFLLPEKLQKKNIAIFIACDDINFFKSLVPESEKIYLRPLNLMELKDYLFIHFDFDNQTIEKLAETLIEYTDGISAVVEIFSRYLQDKTETETFEIPKIAKTKFDEILNRLEQISFVQRKILNILSLADEPVDIGILNEFFKSNMLSHLLQLQSFGAVKIENEKVSITYKALKKHIENKLDDETKKMIHLTYASAYMNYSGDKDADKILYHFTKAKYKKGIEKFAEKGIENFISKGEFKKAINICKEIFDFLPDYLKPSFRIKLADLNFQTGNYKEVISTLEGFDELWAFELMSEAYFHLGDTDKAIEILKHEFKKCDTVYEKARVATKISQILASSGEIDIALSLLKSFEFERILSFIAKTEVIGDFFAGLGIISQLKGKEEKAKIYFELSLKHRLEKKDSFKIIAGYNNIANFHSINGRYDEAISYWKKALEISESIGNITQSAHIYNNIGISYFKRKDHDKAIENYQKALTIYKTINDIPGVANVLGNIGELMIEDFKLEEAYNNIKEAREIYIKTNNFDGLCETNLLFLVLYLNAGDAKNAKLIFNEISQKCREIPPYLIDYYSALIEMKSKNFLESESIFIRLLNSEDIKRSNELYLKILISLLKLNYVAGEIKNFNSIISIAESYAEKVTDLNLSSLLFFLISLGYEGKNNSLALKYLNRSAELLGYEFFEPKWKIYLMLAQSYRGRGLDAKFLQNFEVALLNFQETLKRIKTPEFIRTYLEDVENEKFVKMIQNLKV
ncbi:Serine/threonine protein kinase [Candidatus Kryptobacter tengchongensis]|nr:Serine/threonine protein kinase [Candidatus Kryptobacter tengchongensis]